MVVIECPFFDIGEAKIHQVYHQKRILLGDNFIRVFGSVKMDYDNGAGVHVPTQIYCDEKYLKDKISGYWVDYRDEYKCYSLCFQIMGVNQDPLISFQTRKECYAAAVLIDEWLFGQVLPVSLKQNVE